MKRKLNTEKNLPRKSKFKINEDNIIKSIPINSPNPTLKEPSINITTNSTLQSIDTLKNNHDSNGKINNLEYSNISIFQEQDISLSTSYKNNRISRSYASRLTKHFVPKKDTDLPETFDSKRAFEYKVSKLTTWIKESENIVFFTGAGISTSCNILDFRGSDGIWSKEHRGESVPEFDDSFQIATPSLSHMAIYQLSKTKNIHVITQNVDNLHHKSGLKLDHIIELHGNLFAEDCKVCKKRFIRNYDVQGMGLKPTGQYCTECSSPLVDFCLDWMNALHDEDYEKAAQLCRECDLIICLGTSLRVEPANRLPKKTAKSQGKVVIVNLQETPLDSISSLKINGLCDIVMKKIMKELKLTIPPFLQNETIKFQILIVETCTKNKELFSSIYKESEQIQQINNIEQMTIEKTNSITISESIPNENDIPVLRRGIQIKISSDSSNNRLIYCNQINFCIFDVDQENQNESLNIIHTNLIDNVKIENWISFNFYPTFNLSKEIIVSIEIFWLPILNLKPLKKTITFHQDELLNSIGKFKEFEEKLIIYQKHFDNLTDEDLIKSVPIARKKFYPKDK